MSFREKCYKYVLKKSGEGLNIADGVTINDPRNVAVGERVSIHTNCWIQGYGGVKIGNFVGLASGTKIISSIHDFSSTDVPIKKQGIIKQPVVIGNDVWIGANAIIHGNTTIGDGSVISAGSSVSGEIKPFSIIAGNPGRVIKNRNMDK